MKNKILIIVCILVLIIFIVRSPEDSWIKDKRGIWIKHGSPSAIPDYVSEQKTGIECALQLYQNARSEEMDFSSQCLGTCGDYAVDVVHVPRSGEDNLPENQCKDYKEERVNYFIELDKDGNVVRVV